MVTLCGVSTRSDRVAAVGIFLTVVFATVACGGSASDPHTLPPITPSATASSPSTSATPTDGRQAALVAATAVVRRYFALLNAATTVANADRLERLMTPTCKCRRVAQSTRKVALNDEHYYGTTSVVALTSNFDSPTQVDVLVRYSYTQTGIASSDGYRLTQNRARSGNELDFQLARRGGHWLIANAVVVNK